MAEYIDREATLENALAAVPRDDYFDRQIEFFINNIPAADVRPVVRGKWGYISAFFLDEDFYPARYKCSECGYYVDGGGYKNFCPNCGANIRGGEQ